MDTENAKTAGRSLPGAPHGLSSAVDRGAAPLIPRPRELDVRPPLPHPRQVGLALGLDQIEQSIPQALDLAP